MNQLNFIAKKTIIQRICFPIFLKYFIIYIGIIFLFYFILFMGSLSQESIDFRYSLFKEFIFSNLKYYKYSILAIIVFYSFFLYRYSYYFSKKILLSKKISKTSYYNFLKIGFVFIILATLVILITENIYDITKLNKSKHVNYNSIAAFNFIIYFLIGLPFFTLFIAKYLAKEILSKTDKIVTEQFDFEK